MTEQRRILIVEDDEAMRDTLEAILASAGYHVITRSDGLGLHAELKRSAIDLLVLDLNLPDCDGLSLARELRSNSRLAIIIVTARDEPEERARGLEIGADDYITKPFFPRELVARIHNVLDRVLGDQPRQQPLLQFGNWLLDRRERLLRTTGGEDASLTGAEFDLLGALVEHPGQLMSRESLAEAISDKKAEAGPRSVDILVSRLRKKLLESGNAIETCRGHGYRFTAPVQVLDDNAGSAPQS